MTKEKFQGFMFGLGAGFIVAHFVRHPTDPKQPAINVRRDLNRGSSTKREPSRIDAGESNSPLRRQ
jgi:hypothetical protein